MKKKILIADDNKSFCSFIYKKLIEIEEFEIVGIASTDEDEIKLIEEKEPDVVITDLKRNNEYTGLEIIKKYSTNPNSPQFIIVSAGLPVISIMKYKNVVNFINKLGFDCNKLIMELRIIEKDDTQLRQPAEDNKYRKNRDNKKGILDKEASIIVKRIFEYHMNGWGCSKIAKELNKDRVPTTWEHMKEIGLKISNRNPAKIVRYQTETNETLQIIADKFYLNPKDIIEYNNVLDDFFIENDKKIEERVLKEGIIISIKTRPVWNENSVRNILKNEAYTGYLVLGKYQNKSYKDKTRIRVPEEQWIRVPNCYVPIIDRKTWLIVNNKIDANKEKYNSRSKPQSDGTIPLFSKKVYCECCKSSFSVSTRIKDEKDNYYMRCRGSKKDKGRYAICDNTKTLKKSELENIVLEEINKQIKKYYDLSKVEKNYYDKKINNELNEEISVLEKERNNAINEINKKTNLINLLYEDRANGIISIDEFIILKNSNSRYIELAKERIAKIEEKIFELKKKRDIEIKSKELFSKYKKIKKLDRTIINEFVEKIYIGKYDKETNERNIKIFWNIKES